MLQRLGLTKVRVHPHDPGDELVGSSVDIEAGLAKETRIFPTQGISLSGILSFIEKIGGRSVLTGMTTTEVCNAHIIPMTSDQSQSYCFIQAKFESRDIGTATVFISHAWKYQFLSVVDTLVEYFKDCDPEGKAYLWFDLFSNNQNGLNEPPPFSWWCDVFMLAIKQIGNVVMVMEPWDNPIPLTRAWCLWEIYCSVQTNCHFQVAINNEANQIFSAAIKDSSQAYFQMLNNIDVRNSESFNPLDKQQIFDVILQSVGFQRLNLLVTDRLRHWVMETIRKCISADEKNELKAVAIEYQLALCEVYARQKDYAHLEKSLPFLEENDANVPTYSFAKYLILRNAVHFYRQRSDLKLKNRLYEYVLDVKDAERSRDLCSEQIVACPDQRVKYEDLIHLAHREIARCYFEHVTVYQGSYDLSIYESCINLHLKMYGPDHRHTLECYGVLSAALRIVGNYKRARDVCHSTLEKKKATLGVHHPDTLESMRLLGELHYALYDYTLALTVLEECLNHSIEKFGEDATLVAELRILMYEINRNNQNIFILFAHALNDAHSETQTGPYAEMFREVCSCEVKFFWKCPPIVGKAIVTTWLFIIIYPVVAVYFVLKAILMIIQHHLLPRSLYLYISQALVASVRYTVNRFFRSSRGVGILISCSIIMPLLIIVFVVF